jgi:hypothetical protein
MDETRLFLSCRMKIEVAEQVNYPMSILCHTLRHSNAALKVMLGEVEDRVDRAQVMACVRAVGKYYDDAQVLHDCTWWGYKGPTVEREWVVFFNSLFVKMVQIGFMLLLFCGQLPRKTCDKNKKDTTEHHILCDIHRRCTPTVYHIVPSCVVRPFHWKRWFSHRNGDIWRDVLPSVIARIFANSTISNQRGGEMYIRGLHFRLKVLQDLEIGAFTFDQTQIKNGVFDFDRNPNRKWYFWFWPKPKLKKVFFILTTQYAISGSVPPRQFDEHFLHDMIHQWTWPRVGWVDSHHYIRISQSPRSGCLRKCVLYPGY